MKKIFIIAIALFALILVGNSCIRFGSGSGSGSGSDNGTKYATYKEALAANDFEAAHKILANAESKGKYTGYMKTEIFNKEVVYLATLGDENANKRLMVLLNEEPMAGAARSEGQELGKNKYYSNLDMSDVYSYDSDYYHYIEWCSKYNSRCMQILDIAINLDNQELAKLMVNAIKPDPGITSKKVGKDRYDIYAHYSTHTKDDAKAKYEAKFGKSEN